MIGQTPPLQILRSAAPFSPLDISGLALWADAAYGRYQERTGASATTPAVADADPVGTWVARRNTAEGDLYLTAASDAARPTLKLAIQNGLPVLRFDGSDDWLAFPTLAQELPIYCYAVVSNTGGDGTNRLFMNRSNGPAFYMGNSSTGVLRPAVYWGAFLGEWGSDVVGWHVVRWRVTNDDSAGVRVDSGTDTDGNPLDSVLGNWASLNSNVGVQSTGMDLGELLLYQGEALSVDADTAILAYLAAKYGITLA